MSIFGKHRKLDWPTHYQEMLNSVRDERLRDFYLKGVASADTPISDIIFVALDFETTGLDANNDDIISIGLVPFTLNRIYLNQARHWVVNPNKPLEEESIVIHGITHSDIINAPDLKKVLDEVLESLAGRMVVVHYRNIERHFLDTALKNRIGEGILFPVVDTLEVESEIQKKIASSFLNWLKGKASPSVRLGVSRKRYGLPSYTPHHALTDAIATAELLQAQVAHNYDPSTPISKLWK